jgi:integrase
MKKFESFLARHLDDFILYRQELGYVNRSLAGQLRILDYYVRDNARVWEDLAPAFFLHFRDRIKGSPATVNNVLLATRNFFDYLHRTGCCEYNPVQDLPAKTENAFIPFIFSLEQVEQLLSALQGQIRRAREKCFLVDMGIYMAVMLQARCGLRISEPLNLGLEQYDPVQGTIYIQKTKFHKDRLIPIPCEAQKELDNFLSLRDALCCTSTYLLPGFKNALRTNQVYPVFHRALHKMGIHSPKKAIANMVFGQPTPHSLRHSFAVNTLKAARERGRDPQAVLPVLSAYMGHSKYRYTALYLKVVDAERRQGFVDFAISRLEDI